MTPTPNPDIAAAVAAFNADQWAEAFLTLQTHWLAVRTDEAKALAQYANAVNQLHLGLVTAPRTALQRVLVLTDGVKPTLGVDLGRLRRDVAVLLNCLPPERESDDVTAGAPPGLPHVRLEWLT